MVAVLVRWEQLWHQKQIQGNHLSHNFIYEHCMIRIFSTKINNSFENKMLNPFFYSTITSVLKTQV